MATSMSFGFQKIFGKMEIETGDLDGLITGLRWYELHTTLGAEQHLTTNNSIGFVSFLLFQRRSDRTGCSCACACVCVYVPRTLADGPRENGSNLIRVWIFSVRVCHGLISTVIRIWMDVASNSTV